MPVVSVSVTTYILVAGDTGVFIDLSSTLEQVLDIPHPIGSVPAARQVYVDALADNALNTSPSGPKTIKPKRPLAKFLRRRHGPGARDRREDERILGPLMQSRRFTPSA
jgi:hypothetical protein